MGFTLARGRYYVTRIARRHSQRVRVSNGRRALSIALPGATTTRAGFSSDRPSGVPSALFNRGKIRKGEKKKNGPRMKIEPGFIHANRDGIPLPKRLPHPVLAVARLAFEILAPTGDGTDAERPNQPRIMRSYALLVLLKIQRRPSSPFVAILELVMPRQVAFS